MYEKEEKYMKKVAFATGSRADYGIMREYLRLLNNDENIDLSILVTGLCWMINMVTKFH